MMTPDETHQQAVPGFYPDPYGRARTAMYWDGQGWCPKVLRRGMPWQVVAALWIAVALVGVFALYLLGH